MQDEKADSPVSIDSSESGPHFLRQESPSEEIIDLGGLITPDMTCSGSFDLRGIETTSIGKLLQALPIPAIVVGRSLEITFLNQACGKISPEYEKMSGKPFASLFPTTTSAAAAQELIQGIFETRKSGVAESPLQIDDKRIWARMNFRSLRLGPAQSVMLLVEDLTPEKRQLVINQRYQEELRKAGVELEKRVLERTSELLSANNDLTEIRRRQKALMDNIPDMAWLRDAQCRFVAVNQAFGAACGIDPEELTGKTSPDACATDLAITRAANDMQVISSGHSERQEETITDASGESRCYEIIRTPIFDETGVAIGVTGIARDITRRKKAEDEVRASLREKEALLQEVHHRVKNNLQIISSLLALQEAGLEDESIKDIFRDSQTRIRSMASLHEKLCQSKDLARIDIQDYVREITGALFQYYPDSGSRIRLKLDVDDVSMNVGTALACGLIINELVSNCFKHAFAAGPGEIRIQLRAVGNDYTIVVADNGCGLPADFDFRSSKSLGAKLIANLTELQLGGAMEVKNNGGAQVKITFTIANRKGK